MAAGDQDRPVRHPADRSSRVATRRDSAGPSPSAEARTAGTRSLGSRTDRGHGSLEYVGLGLLVAAVVAGLLASGLGRTVAGSIERAIRCIPAGQAGPQCAPRGETPAPTPLERATRGDYVALGDSYSSGEGGSEFRAGTDRDKPVRELLDEHLWWPGEVEHNLCHRSERAYSRVIAERLDFAGDVEFHACSGASLVELATAEEQDNVGELPQFEHLDEDTSLVTLSMGGNDVGFADVMRACLRQGLNPHGNCRENLDTATRAEIGALRSELTDTYAEIRRRAPNARVLVVGYPRLFPAEPVRDVALPDWLPAAAGIDAPDQRWLNETARLLNDTTRAAAREAGVEYVDVHSTLDGHELGTADPWIHDLSFEVENASLLDMDTFHPGDRGQAAIARRVEHTIRNGG